MRRYAAVSDGDHESRQLCEVHGVRHVVVPNDPLGAKHNAALELALADGHWHVAMLLPSDDFMDVRWVAQGVEVVDGGAHYVMPARCGIYDVATGRAMVMVSKEHGVRRFGAARMISRHAIEQVWPLWTAGKARGLDTDSHARLVGAGFDMRVVVTDYLPVTDVKGEGNLWSYDTWSGGRGVERGTPEQVLGMMSQAHQGQILAATAAMISARG